MQFHRGALHETILGRLRQRASLPTGFEVEITEFIFLEGSEATLKLLHALRALGVRVALDDFGTGYSSLSYLQSFPFDKLKIDRSFIQNLLTREGASAIVRAITELANALDIETTAEGVEETAQLMELRAHGCSSVQGFLFAEPMTRERRRAAFPTKAVGAIAETSPDRLVRRVTSGPFRSTPVQPVSAIATRISASISLSSMRDARFARGCERIGPGPPKQDEVRAERKHPHDVEPRANAAVDEDRQFARRSRRQSRGSARAVERAPSS